jgi:hypothetical protein
VAISSVLIEGPTEEPLTLDQGKLRAGLDWPTGDPRDDLMTGFIAAARSQVEQRTGLALLTQTRDVTFAWLECVMPLPWQALPVQSMTDPAGNPVASTRYRVEGRSVYWGVAPPVGTWRIVAGWPSPAALALEAPLLVHAVGLLTAHYATLGRDLAVLDTVSTVPAGFEDAIAPYVLVVVP